MTKKSKRDRKGDAVGKAVGKAVNKTYKLISNPIVIFHTHEDCWQYAVDNSLTKVKLSTWIRRGIWKQFFEKVK